MSVSIPILDKSDPKENIAAVPFHMPQQDPFWTGSPDYLSTLAMSMAGGAMFTKNRYFAWPAFFLSSTAYLNATPLRATETSSGSSLQGLGFAIVGLLSVYLPTLVLLPDGPSKAPAV
ncbi:hypothetical protein [Phaffia rhodozyma]|uniref:Uncharacterized protein n=1 Tax=Phaffia rhodozyma TaxID=264483 RepID=A0A0F7SEX1_PHARH|nr:hypothetical protein [Phaffia rhodozyma]